MRLRWTFGTPPKPLEVAPVEKHARMAERGHGDRRRGLQRTRVSWDFATGPPHVVGQNDGPTERMQGKKGLHVNISVTSINIIHIMTG